MYVHGMRSPPPQGYPYVKLAYNQAVIHNRKLGLSKSMQQSDLQSCIRATNGVDNFPSWNQQLLLHVCNFLYFLYFFKVVFIFFHLCC